jgi:hypothetical protein
LSVGSQSIIPVSSDSGYNKEKLLNKISEVLEIYNDDFYKEKEEDEEL